MKRKPERKRDLQNFVCRDREVDGEYSIYTCEDGQTPITPQNKWGEWTNSIDGSLRISVCEWQLLGWPELAPGEGPVRLNITRPIKGDACFNCARCKPCCTLLDGNPPIESPQEDNGCEFFDRRAGLDKS